MNFQKFIFASLLIVSIQAHSIQCAKLFDSSISFFKKIKEIKTPAGISAGGSLIKLSSDGKYLAVLKLDAIQIIDLHLEKAVFQRKVKTTELPEIQFSPDVRYAAINLKSSFLLLDLRSGLTLPFASHSNYLTAFSVDSKQIAFTDSLSSYIVLNLENFEVIRRVEQGQVINRLVFNEQGRFINELEFSSVSSHSHSVGAQHLGKWVVLSSNASKALQQRFRLDQMKTLQMNANGQLLTFFINEIFYVFDLQTLSVRTQAKFHSRIESYSLNSIQSQLVVRLKSGHIEIFDVNEEFNGNGSTLSHIVLF